MTKLKYSLAVLILFSSLSAIASGSSRTRNGGDVVFCAQANSYELLDHFEARGLIIQRPIGYSPEAVANGFLKAALEKQFPVLTQRWIKKVSQFRSITKFISDGLELPDIDDAHPTNLPKGCELKQVAVQTSDAPPGQPQIEVDKFLWDKLPLNQQALLIIHEVILSEIIKEGIEESSALRQFVGLIASESFLQSQPTDVNRISFFSKELKFNYYEKFGILFYIGQPKDCTTCGSTRFGFGNHGELRKLLIDPSQIEISYDQTTIRGADHRKNIVWGKVTQSKIYFDNESGDISIGGLFDTRPSGNLFGSFIHNLTLNVQGSDKTYLLRSKEFDFIRQQNPVNLILHAKTGHMSFNEIDAAVMVDGEIIESSLISCEEQNCLTVVDGPRALVERILPQSYLYYSDSFEY